MSEPADSRKSEPKNQISPNDLRGLEALFDHSPAGLALFEAEPPYRVITHNAVYQSFWDEPHRSRGVKGLSIADYAPLAEEGGAFEVFRRVARTGRAEIIEGFAYDGLSRGRTWWNWHLAAVYEAGELAYFAHTLIEVTAEHLARLELEAEIEKRRRAEAELVREKAFLDAVIEAAPVGISIARDPQGKAPLLNDKARQMCGLDSFRGNVGRYSLLQAVHEDGTPYAVDDYPTVRALQQGVQVEAEPMIYERDGERRRWLVNSKPLFDAEGNVDAAVTALMDVEDRIRAEEQARLLARELDHRLKNVFSVTQSLVALSARGDPAAERFADTLRERIQALALAHDVSIGRRGGEGLDFETFSQAVLAPYTELGRRLKICGPRVHLEANLATGLGLVLHELATNAAKYGAWSREEGDLSLTWAVEERPGGDETKPWVKIDWTERAPGLDLAPGSLEQTGFGSKLIDLSLQQIGGHLSRSVMSGGLNCVLHIPLAGED